MIFWQAAVNIAVVTNSAPYTGVTLPFLSFGGSSTVVSLAAIGMLLAISGHPAGSTARRVDRVSPRGPEETAGRAPPRWQRPAAEPVLSSVGQLAEPIPFPSARRGGGSRERRRAR